MQLDFGILVEYLPLFIKGLGMTIGLALLTVVLGTLLGTPLATAKLSQHKVWKRVASIYIEVVRGTPLLLQLYIFAYGIPLAIPSFYISPFAAGVLALTLNSAAYVAEVIRAGIQSVDIGQMEAARSLGLSRSKAMRKVIIPQAFKNVLPALGNEFVTVVKESSIVSIVGIVDVMKITNVVSSQEFTMFEALIFAGLLYFIVTYSISKLIQRMERRLDVHARH
jgi:polar amino acid transport system permease protein